MTINIKHKIAFIYTVLTAFVLVVLGIVVYTFALFYTTDEFFKRLDQRALITAKAHFEKDNANARIYKKIRRKYMHSLPEEQEYVFRSPLTKSNIENTALPGTWLRKVMENGKAYFRKKNLYGTSLQYSDGDEDYIILVTARDIYGFNKLFHLRRSLVLSTVLLLGLVYTLGYYYSLRLLRPIKKIITNVQNIKASNLDQRLPLNKAHENDELGKLTSTFNDMLSRLETSFEIQSKFITHASHELKNPLTAILGEVEIALSKDRNKEAYVKSLHAVKKESLRLKTITLNLLELSKISYDNKNMTMSPIRVDEILIELRNIFLQHFPSADIQFYTTQMPRFWEGTLIWGNYHLMRTALSNIIENSCKFSIDIKIHITLSTANETLIITMADEGIGIPEKDLHAIFETFYRSKNARAYQGHGIGLPLTKNIISIHQGGISVDSRLNTGTTFTIRLPLYYPM